MRRPQTAIERDAAAELRAENEQLREALTHMLRVFTPRTGEPGPDMYVETVAWTHAEAVLHRLRDLRRDYDAAVEDAADLLEDAFRQGAHEVTAESGLHADLIGWFDTASLSAWRDVGEWLVAHAGWERHPSGIGRRQFYRPPQEESER